MKRLIYYPSFETYNYEWLKFALLYIEELKPIVPLKGDKYLSDLYHKLMDETDLLNLHRPEFNEGEFASQKAIDAVEKVVSDPDRYCAIFRSSNILNNWRNRRNHIFTIFDDKFTHAWENFCSSNKFSTKTRNGIKVSKTLGNIYMTVLAHSIGQMTNISPITERKDLDRFSIFLASTTNTDNCFELAKNIIKIQIPKDLKNISFDDIINLRNKQGYKEKLKSFHNELERFISNDRNIDPESFIKSYNLINKAFLEDFLSFGFDITAMGLGVWLVLSSGDSSYMQSIKELSGMTSFAIGSVRRVLNFYGSDNQQRLCRRYLANLKAL